MQHVHIHIHTHTHTYIHTHTHTYIHIYIHTHTYTYIYTYTYTQHIYIYIHLHTHIHIHIHTYIHAYIHTLYMYIHTQNYEKAWLKRKVFKSLLKCLESRCVLSPIGREFQRVGPAHEKARRPSRSRFTLGTTMRDWSAERRLRQGT